MAKGAAPRAQPIVCKGRAVEGLLGRFLLAASSFLELGNGRGLGMRPGAVDGREVVDRGWVDGDFLKDGRVALGTDDRGGEWVVPVSLDVRVHWDVRCSGGERKTKIDCLNLSELLQGRKEDSTIFIRSMVSIKS